MIVIAEKKKRGPKGKYAEWLTEDGLTRIESWARDGLTDEQIYNNMAISKETYYKYKAQFPEINDALKRGKAPVDFEVENLLLKRARGYEYYEERIEREIIGYDEEKKPIYGKRSHNVRIKKHVPPDVTAMIFWLKCRKPDVWRERREITVASAADFKALDKAFEGIELDDPTTEGN